jgi:two-component system, NtrC family, nitrogen regulation sensor histidine kinase NtrY
MGKIGDFRSLLVYNVALTSQEPELNSSTTSGNPIIPAIRFLRRVFTPTVLVLAFFIFVLAIGIADYIVLTSPLEVRQYDETVLILFALNGSAILIFVLALGWRIVKLMTARRQGRAGSQLHLQFVTLFGVFAVIPAVLMGIFSVVTLNLGVDRYFDSRIEIALDNAQAVAEAYADSHKVNVIIETKSVLRELAVVAQMNPDSVTPEFLSTRLTKLATEANFTGAYLLDGTGEVQIFAEIIERPILPSKSDLSQIPENQIIVRTVEDKGQIQAIAKVPVFTDIYFLGVRSVSPEILGSAHYTREIVDEYRRMGQTIFSTKEIYLLTYLIVAAFMVAVAMWVGFWMAQRMIDPIGKLVGVAEKISNGDLTARVDVADNDDELATLGRSFNRMTGQLFAQRNDLVEANRQYDERRRFTEAVLSGVSAGVVGLDTLGRVTIANRSAYELLETRPDELIGMRFMDVVPEMAELVEQALSSSKERNATVQGQIDLVRAANPHNFNVQVSNEGVAGEAQSLVVTFDDITDLVNAQRTSAWADVARRIAHEIKNPLTPIQLSAERLKRKYSKEISSDPEVFNQCTDTIVRQVGDIGRMVDEFSSFARMPTAVLKKNDLAELIHQSVFLQEVANPQIDYDRSIAKEPIFIECDGRLISQAVTNILKNAGEAISARVDTEENYQGEIKIDLVQHDHDLTVVFTDNGCGLPSVHRHRLTEPYMTTREKGTGLGLAIVKKIMEEHKGVLIIEDRKSVGDDDETGARVQMVFHNVMKDLNEMSSEYQDAAPDAAAMGAE